MGLPTYLIYMTLSASVCGERIIEKFPCFVAGRWPLTNFIQK
jgi:hypothetical protein